MESHNHCCMRRRFDPIYQMAVYAIPIWIALMWICHGIKHKRGVSQALYGEA
jgi:aromatic amino acid transport protein AroP